MADAPGAEQRLITVDILSHETTDLLVAVSDDLRGLMVQGRSIAEVKARIPGAITELLEAQGNSVLDIDTGDAGSSEKAAKFVSARFVASARVLRGH